VEDLIQIFLFGVGKRSFKLLKLINVEILFFFFLIHLFILLKTLTNLNLKAMKLSPMVNLSEGLQIGEINSMSYHKQVHIFQKKKAK